MSKMKQLHEITQLAKTLVQMLEDIQGVNTNENEATDGVVLNEQPVSFEAIQKFLAEKSREGFTKEIRQLIQSFGHNKLSELDPSVYPELWKAVEGLSDVK